MKTKIKISGLIGDFNWNIVRNLLILQLTKCKDEKDFIKVIENILKAIGTKEKLSTIRNELGIKSFTKKDKNKLKELK